MENNFKMIAKTFFGFEEILAKELQLLGAQDVEQGIRMVSFKAVSYTHLDVYKRQSQCCVVFLRLLLISLYTNNFYSFCSISER